MKNILFMATALMLLLGCNQSERYSQNSPEIDTVKKLVANYNAKNYDTEIYADTAKVLYNSRKNGMSPTEAMNYHKEADANYSSRGFMDKGQEFEMVVTDEGHTWVNAWLDWKGTMAATGKEITVPVHLTCRFVDGKIVREVGYWDPSEVVMELQAQAALNNLPPEDNRKIVNGMYQSFANGDIPAVLDALDPKVVWMEAEGNPYADGNPYIGPDAVSEGIFSRIGENYDSFALSNIKLHEMGNDQVLATLRYKAKPKNSEEPIDVQAAHLWTLNNGKVVAFQQYADTKKLHESLNQ